MLYSSLLLLLFICNIECWWYRDPTAREAVTMATLVRMHNAAIKNGIFVGFLKDLLDVLNDNYPLHRLQRFTRLLGRHLRGTKYRYSRKLGEHLVKLSNGPREDLKDRISRFRQDLEEPTPLRAAFLNAMNDVFTLQQYGRFRDYVYDVRDYGTMDKLYLDEETDKLINYVIINTIQERLDSKGRSDLLKKLKDARKEYLEDY